MTKIYFVGDTHFGKAYPFKKIWELNISERSLDIIQNCEQIITSAIKEKADCVIFLGDLYDRRNISATIRRIVREKVFIPLNEHQIPTIVIGGNHDSIRNPKRGADVQELANFPNVEVYTDLAAKIITSNGIKIGFLFLPFIHFDVLVEIAKKNQIPIEGNYNNYIIAQHLFKNYIKQICESKLKDCNKRILIGHYYLDGAKIRETNNPSMIYGEFIFNKEMVQKEYFDLVMFGHVHLRQTMWNDDRIVIPGSIDRIDMSERNSKKFYCTYEVEKDDLQYHPIECRDLIKREITIPNNTEDLTQYIIQNLPEKEQIKEAICKITINFPKGKEVKIDKKVIDRYFNSSFYVDLIYIEQALDESQQLREVNLDPRSLFQDYLAQKYREHKFYSDLRSIGQELIEKEISLIDLTATGPLSIKSIDMQYFNKYGKGPNKVVFDDNLYVIKGPTGAGKSSILDAITFALFKKNTRKDAGLTLSEILYDKGYVHLELLIGDNILSVKRSQRSPKLDIRIDDTPLYQGLSIPDKEMKLEDIIGYDYESFISSFFIRQQELQIFSILTSGERQERFIKLFKLKIFKDIYKKLKATIDGLKSTHDKLEGEIKGLAKDLDELPQKKEELKRKQDELEAKIQLKDKLTAEVQILRDETERLQLKASQYSRTQELIEEVEGDIDQYSFDIQTYKSQQLEVTELQNQLAGIPDYKEEKKELESKKSEIEQEKLELEKTLSEISKYETLIEQTEKQYNEQLETIQSQKKDKEDRLSGLDFDLTKDEAFRLIKEDGTLTERLYRLQHIEIPLVKEYKDSKREEEFTVLENQTKKDLAINKPKQEKISKDIFLVDELEVNRNELEEQYKTIEQKMKESTAKYQEEINKLGDKSSLEVSIQGLNKKLVDVKEKLQEVEETQKIREEIEDSLREKNDFSLLIEKTQKDLEDLNEKLDKRKKELTKVEGEYNRYLEVASEFGKKQTVQQELEKQIEGLKVEIDYINKAIQKMKDDKANIKEIEQEINEVKDKIEKYKLLREDIFHANGVPQFAIEKILPAVSIRASEILSDLTDGKFNQITFKPLTGVKRVGFDIYVFDGEREREVSSFSGGEKTQINASIRIAIMERIAEIPDTAGAVFRKSNTLFIDEGDLGTLDDETARQRFIEKIFELKSIFKSIILITHIEDVAEQFPNRIVVGWDQFGNSKIF